MTRAVRFDHVGITVADLDAAIAFFVSLGLEVEGRMLMEGDFVETVIGIPGSRSEIATLRLPDGGTGLELSSFVHPDHEPGSPSPMANELGLRNVAFQVDGLQAVLDRLAADGFGLVGGVGRYEDMWRMAYVRGPEGIIVALAERIDKADQEPVFQTSALTQGYRGLRVWRFSTAFAVRERRRPPEERRLPQSFRGDGERLEGTRGLRSLLAFWPFRVLLIAVLVCGFLLGGIG